jgi:ATP-binding cassette subfamily B (MDR/TAP) protein 1
MVSLGAPIVPRQSGHTDQPTSSPHITQAAQPISTIPSFPPPASGSKVEPIPQAPNIHDELHPSNPSNTTLTDPEDERTIETIVENEKQNVIAETTIPTGGMFMPSATGAMGPIPGLPTLNPTKIAKAAQADPSSSTSNEKPRLSASPSQTNSSSSSTTDSQPTKALPTGKMKRSLIPFRKSRKDADTQNTKSKQKEEEANALPPVGILELFRFSTPTERALNILGLLLAAAAGATQPLMTLIFGRLTNSFTAFAVIVNNITQNGVTVAGLQDLENARRQLKVDSGHNALYLVAIGVGMFICTW